MTCSYMVGYRVCLSERYILENFGIVCAETVT